MTAHDLPTRGFSLGRPPGRPDAPEPSALRHAWFEISDNLPLTGTLELPTSLAIVPASSQTTSWIKGHGLPELRSDLATRLLAMGFEVEQERSPAEETPAAGPWVLRLRPPARPLAGAGDLLVHGDVRIFAHATGRFNVRTLGGLVVEPHVAWHGEGVVAGDVRLGDTSRWSGALSCTGELDAGASTRIDGPVRSGTLRLGQGAVLAGGVRARPFDGQPAALARVLTPAMSTLDRTSATGVANPTFDLWGEREERQEASEEPEAAATAASDEPPTPAPLLVAGAGGRSMVTDDPAPIWTVGRRPSPGSPKRYEAPRPPSRGPLTSPPPGPSFDREAAPAPQEAPPDAPGRQPSGQATGTTGNDPVFSRAELGLTAVDLERVLGPFSPADAVDLLAQRLPSEVRIVGHREAGNVLVVSLESMDGHAMQRAVNALMPPPIDQPFEDGPGTEA